MSTVAAIPPDLLAERLCGPGLRFKVPPFTINLISPLDQVRTGIERIYGPYELAPAESFADFHIQLQRGAGLRRYLGKPQSRFLIDGFQPFLPLPANHAYPSFEWGLNWCVSNHSHQYLVIHAGVVERDGRAAILAAPPGAGKSTLCAGLCLRGWRLLSDELTLVRLGGELIDAFTRPICLKNESIDLIRRFAPDCRWGPTVDSTRKGRVAHLAPPVDQVRRGVESARPAWIVFPKYVQGSPVQATGVGKARAAVRLASNAFNFDILGGAGFESLSKLADICEPFDFSYSDLDDAVAFFDELTGER